MLVLDPADGEHGEGGKGGFLRGESAIGAGGRPVGIAPLANLQPQP